MTEFREIAMHSPRNPGRIVRMKLPVSFTQYRLVDDLAVIVVDIMNHRASFTMLPPCAAAFAAVQLALIEAVSAEEIHRGKSIMQAIRAIRIPILQPVICHEALLMLREVDPQFNYPTGFRQS